MPLPNCDPEEAIILESDIPVLDGINESESAVHHSWGELLLKYRTNKQGDLNNTCSGRVFKKKHIAISRINDYNPHLECIAKRKGEERASVLEVENSI